MPESARELFERVKNQKYEPLLRGVRGTYQFDIKQVGTWFLSVNDGVIIVEDARPEADCTISCSEQDFVDIVTGRRNMITALMQGRIQVRGDLALVQKFHGVIGARIEEQRGAA